MSTDEPFWIYQPEVLFTDFVTDLTSTQTLNQRLNVITRLLLVMIPLVWFVDDSLMWTPILLTLLLVVIIVGVVHHRQESFTPCQTPTKHNPLMNVQLADLRHHVDRPPACPSYQPQTSQVVRQHLEGPDQVGPTDPRLFFSPEELWGQQSMERQFYTNPATTIPNDREKFMNWCWNVRNVCKDGDQEACLEYEDMRLPSNEDVFF